MFIDEVLHLGSPHTFCSRQISMNLEITQVCRTQGIKDIWREIKAF